MADLLVSLDCVDARDRYEALTPTQRARVDEILAPELARGWVPKAADVLAVIETVLAQDAQR